jgi:hypothetical protein
MLGAILVTPIGILLMMPLREWGRWTVVPRLGEPLYRRNVALTIGKRWVRPQHMSTNGAG